MHALEPRQAARCRDYDRPLSILLLLSAAIGGCTHPPSEAVVARKLQASSPAQEARDVTAVPSLRDRTAVALIRVHSQPPRILGGGRLPDEPEPHMFHATQAALLTSPFVIEAALRSPDLDGISQISNADDPIHWVRERVDVAFPGNGEIMEVRVSEQGLPDDELTRLADAVCRAYLEEVVEAERTDKLLQKDILEAQFNRFRDELARKRAEHAEVADELALAEARRDLLRIQYRNLVEERRALARKATEAELEFQLQLIDLNASPEAQAETPAAEVGDSPSKEASAGEGGGRGQVRTAADRRGEPTRPWHRWHPAEKAYDRYQTSRKGLQEHIEALNAEVLRVEERLVSPSDRPVSLSPLEDEIRRYERLVDEMGDRLLRCEVELAAPSRVRMVQNAVIHEGEAVRNTSRASK